MSDTSARESLRAFWFGSFDRKGLSGRRGASAGAAGRRGATSAGTATSGDASIAEAGSAAAGALTKGPGDAPTPCAIVPRASGSTGKLSRGVLDRCGVNGGTRDADTG